MNDPSFICDTASEFGLDVTVHSKEMDSQPKVVHSVRTRVDGEKYLFELVSNTGTSIQNDEIAVRQLHDSLITIREAIESEFTDRTEE